MQHGILVKGDCLISIKPVDSTNGKLVEIFCKKCMLPIGYSRNLDVSIMCHLCSVDERKLEVRRN